MRRIEAIISRLGVWLLCSFAHRALSAGDATTRFNRRGPLTADCGAYQPDWTGGRVA